MANPDFFLNITNEIVQLETSDQSQSLSQYLIKVEAFTMSILLNCYILPPWTEPHCLYSENNILHDFSIDIDGK